tara:strand:+ start:1626 stop:2108 length:483 start_codon:yes stop_codon:yes gene_type:complete
MAFTGSSKICRSFKKELFEGKHNFLASGGNTVKMALYTNSQAGNDNLGGSGTDMDFSVTAYSSSASNEVSGGNYTTGGHEASRVDPIAGTSTSEVGAVTFGDITISNATITARGGLLYNDTNGDRAIAVIDFTENKTSTSGTFTIDMPASGVSTSLIRLT